MEGHERKPDVSAGRLTFHDSVYAVLDRHKGLIRSVGRLVIISAIIIVAFVISRLLVGMDGPVLIRVSPVMALEHLLIYYLIGYRLLPGLLYRRRFGWLVFWFVVSFWISYLINRYLILTAQPTLPQAVGYISRIRALVEPVGPFGCFVSLRVFLWNFVFSLVSPIVFLTGKFLKDAVVYRQQQFSLRRNRLLLEQDNALLKLNFLKAQVSPHFLFNTLNSIYARVVDVDDSAADLVLRLAELMRYNLYEAPATQLPVSQELDYIQSYVVLEQARHGDQLLVQLDLDTFDGYQIAPLLLIAFVENAFKHGVKSGTKGAYVQIRATRQQDSLIFTVENSISQGLTIVKARKSGGVGLPNVQKRLTLLYPGRHQLTHEVTDQYYRVKLQIDLSMVNQPTSKKAQSATQ